VGAQHGRATIAEVAERAGVSLTTVSHVLSQRRPVAEATRRHVLQVIEDMGYEPDSAAAVMAGAASRTLAVDGLSGTWSALSELVEPRAYFYTGVYHSIEIHATRAGYDLLTPSRPHDATGRGYVRRLRSRRVAGAIMMARSIADLRVQGLLDAQFPTVFVDSRGTGPRATYVTSDHRGGGRQAVEHLIALGHRRIARVSNSADPLAGRYRIEGGRDALAAAGLPEDRGLVVETDDWDAESAYRATITLLERGLPFTAIAVSSDVMAINVIGALVDRGLRVPADVSVVGFDDLPLSSMIRPMLTTVRQDVDAMGAAVVESVQQMIERDHTRGPVTVPTALVVRGSTAPPR
jgi:DNA-binding LacI/PurR family transcriptional regulator